MKTYRERMHYYGRIFTVLGIVAMIAVPFSIWFFSGVAPNVNDLFAGVLVLSVLYLPGGIIEVLTYGPILGTSGTYLAFITGNLVNLKIPCVMNAKDIAGTEINTEENEIVSTIAVAFSSITTVLIMSFGVMMLLPLKPILESELLAPAFNTVVSALFGALGYKYFKGNLKLVIAPLIFVIILSLVAPSFVYNNIVIVILLAAIVTILVARVLWVKKLL
ncbi:MAG: hypothetical protein PHF05_04635 [Candidatus Izemoplasmatales bacterium]|nr:hypothetical protein [Candidatus Izemoplasmatales bacterium]MDD4069723.1 hypothetical protein [Candidatus Izemoplasmatales bacterium]MDY0139168.1 hypothetical protein [Candidatus Izemoplasmatales bacterium]